MMTAKNKSVISSVLVCICLGLSYTPAAQKVSHLRLGVFEADVTPPIGSPVAYAITRSIRDPLSARGVVLFIDDQKPVVLCAVDWIGIANEGQDVWKKKLAEAAHTTTDRVSIHALHQHDGVSCDFTMEKIMKEYHIDNLPFDDTFLFRAIQNVADSVAVASANATDITDIGFGQAKVEKVASNRRIMGPHGKVALIRWSSKNDSATIAAPEGLVDPWLKCVSFWNAEKPVAVITYYATHPQSYYGEGDVTCEFIGMARNAREKSMGGLPHIHFNGAGGNITTGKYNDGTEALRQAMAKRVESAMRQAWEHTVKTPLTDNIGWKSTPVILPLGKNIVEENLRSILSDEKSTHGEKLSAAEKLAWYQRWKNANITVSAVRLGKIWLLNLPGELFVEYQLRAQQMKPGEEVCTAAYEEYGPGYIGTAIAYTQGGYETSDLNSGVAPEVEAVLIKAIKKVLK
ncbi:MAG: hypothetical protein ABI416_00545 [Ginsengibacter sp.]